MISNKNQKAVILLFAILSIFLFESISANFDLISGRHELFMDERITFDGIRKIIHPNGIGEFLWAIMDGGDQRYGRILWNSTAFFSFIPEAIYGEGGQIVASRIFQTALILFSYLILAFGMLNNWIARIALAIVIFTMPYVAYYSTMPKPEPIQIFFISLFFLYFYRNKLKFGWYYIFIGIAFGAKISTLFILLPFFITSLTKYIWKRDYNDTSIYIASIYFLIGLGISVPILLFPILEFIIASSIILYIFNRNNNKLINIKCIISVIILFISIIFLNRRELNRWLNATFFNTTHGADNYNINAWSWVEYFINTWLISPKYISIFFIILLSIFILTYITYINLNKKYLSNKICAVIIFLSGLFFSIGIFIFSHRLWGFYLYPGVLVLIFGAIMMFDIIIMDNDFPDKSVKIHLYVLFITKFFGYFIFVLIILIGLFYWGPSTLRSFNDLQSRTISNEYYLENDAYNNTKKILNQLSSDKGRQILVMYSPSLFFPTSNSKFQTEEFWGPYLRWKESFDAIVLHNNNTPLGEAYSRQSPNYNDYLIEQQGYKDHVVFARNVICKVKPCYYRSIRFSNGSEVLIKTDD